MAEIKPIQLVPNIATPFKDSRAEGYVSYYTKVGWDRWNLSLQQVEQDIKDRKIEYDAAMDVYQTQLKAIADEKEALQKKLADIALKKADVGARRADKMAAMEEARLKQIQAQETSKEQKLAVEPSKGSGGGGGVGFVGAREPVDMVLDQISGQDKVVVADRIKTLAGGVTTGNISNRLSQLSQYYNTGGLPSDAPTKDITSYAIYDSMAKDLASKEYAGDILQAKIQIFKRATPEIQDQIKRGEERIKQIEERQAGVSSGAYSSRGAFQTPYDIAKFEQDVANLDLEAKEYANIENELAKKLEEAQQVQIERPTLEPTDLITAARKTYLDKFGNIPEGVSLRAGGETLSRYKELMPFEITNALKGVQSFFQDYIDREISAAKAASPSGLLTKDETSFAIERGKSAARKALFGTTYTQQEAARVSAGLPPQEADPYAVLAENLKKTGEDIAAANPASAGQVRADISTLDKVTAVVPQPEVPEVKPPVQKPPAEKPGAAVIPIPELTQRLSTGTNAADRSFLGISPTLKVTREAAAPAPVGYTQTQKEEAVGPILPPVPSLTTPIGGTTMKGTSGPVQTPEQKSTKEKTSAFLEGAEKAKRSPSAAAQDILKDSIGKYVAATYETNKAKGPSALPLSDLTNTIVSEYAGDMKKQAKAVRLLTQLAYLDDTKNQIK
jgi:hypothetical protein